MTTSLQPKQIAQLEAIVGTENCLTAGADRLTHAYDATQRRYLPHLVVYPNSTEEVSRIMCLAHAWRLPVTPRGAGSGFSGGALPVMGGIVLVLTRMNRILEIDRENFIAVVEPGVVTADFQRQVESLGLFYPPDPASKEFCTLGGNIAENAGGPRCLKYGVTRDYVLGLTVVSAQGEVFRCGGRTLKNVVGYDLTHLFVGSEGTLAIVTAMTLRLLPKPASKKTMLAQFASIGGAARAVTGIIAGKIIPATLEFMDAATLSCVRDRSPIPLPDQCKAALIIETDGDAVHAEAQMAAIAALIAPHDFLGGQLAATSEEAERIWQVRRAISPSLKQLGPDKFNEDIVVPRAQLPDMIAALEEIAVRFQVRIVNFGHAGDGNIHVNIMVDLSQDGVPERARQAVEAVFQAAVRLGGSISGEHGIGTVKAGYLGLEIDPVAMSMMRRVKAAFDPDNILNPEKIFPPL
ncbi:MAG: FAD-binding protein [Desulfobulbaceae bacterium]|jgi:glycolate oxidase|nr:FAD-binding protein [Desulfobulbaceae bacterium]